MATYWVTFRIADQTIQGRTYDDRRDELIDAVKACSSKYWDQPTSFMAFESSTTIDSIATALKGAISVSHDLFLMRQMDNQSAIICGKNDDRDIYGLIPYLRAI